MSSQDKAVPDRQHSVRPTQPQLWTRTTTTTAAAAGAEKKKEKYDMTCSHTILYCIVTPMTSAYLVAKQAAHANKLLGRQLSHVSSPCHRVRPVTLRNTGRPSVQSQFHSCVAISQRLVV